MQYKEMIGVESRFTGGLWGLIGIGILQIVLGCLTLGLWIPWGVCMRERWYADHTTIDGRQVVFDGHGEELFLNYLKWALLTVITFGIYGFWLSLKMKAWIVEHTHLV